MYCAHLCSGGRHPFEANAFTSIPQNILTHKRNPLRDLGIVDKTHVELVDRFTTNDATRRWTAENALTQCAVFHHSFEHDTTATLLFDMINLHHETIGSCRDQLLNREIIEHFPYLEDVVRDVDKVVAQRIAVDPEIVRAVPEDFLYAVYCYTYHNAIGGLQDNIYFQLNGALRSRKVHPAKMRPWKGYLSFLMRALKHFPNFEGIVYRGGNRGIDRDTIASEYKVGRTIQWAAFSSTSVTVETTKQFVHREKGVIFKIQLLRGRAIGGFSFFPNEHEVLVSPNAQFVVTSATYLDADGYTFVDLVEKDATSFSSC